MNAQYIRPACIYLIWSLHFLGMVQTHLQICGNFSFRSSICLESHFHFKTDHSRGLRNIPMDALDWEERLEPVTTWSYLTELQIWKGRSSLLTPFKVQYWIWDHPRPNVSFIHIHYNVWPTENSVTIDLLWPVVAISLHVGIAGMYV